MHLVLSRERSRNDVGMLLQILSVVHLQENGFREVFRTGPWLI
jgi:hypothetical protein